jgi:hypothetical protein
MATNTIDHGTFSRLVEAGAVRAAHVVGQPGGWALMVKYGMHERPLAAKNTGAVRVWRRFETLASYLKDVGLTQFDVDASNYDPTSSTAARRPDRAEALKNAHEAAAYDKWFREQVQASIEDPRQSVSDEEANAHMEQVFASLEQEARR